MSSDLFILDGSNFLRDSSIDSPNADLIFSDPLLCSSFDIFHEFNNPVSNSSITATNNTAFSPTSAADFLLSSSPPSHQLQGLTLQGFNSSHHLAAGNYYGGDYWGGRRPDLDVKTEECHVVGSETYSDEIGIVRNSVNNDGSNVMMQRSYSDGNSLYEGRSAAGFLFQPPSFESPNQPLRSPESNLFAEQMRRVYSTGDLQNTRRAKATRQRSISSTLATEKSSLTDESVLKVERYSAEEKKERISKYRAKRSQRNFNKTIKYACRKTLADRRSRVGGRFARNVDGTHCEIPRAESSSTLDEDHDDHYSWVNYSPRILV
ncbi:Zinc finger protein CONSTANS-LIKE 3 [Linum perenne]